MQQGVLNTLKLMTQRKMEYVPCLLKRFISVLRDDENYTIFTNVSISKEEGDWMLDKYVMDLPGPSSSLHSTGTTTMLSTTAPIVIQVADVPQRIAVQRQSIWV